MPVVVLVAPGAFKGTLGPRQVAEAIAAGVRRALPEASVLECPVADGGNGLLDAVLPPGALRERLPVTGPVGESVSAELGWIDDETAIFESSSACGLALLEPEERDPLRTTTRGVGELIWEAADRGAKTVVVGLGGSATVDGGTGAARGLGTMPMGGAAGGLGAGLAFFARAELRGGAGWVLARVGFDAALAKADLVITAEGVFDRTSFVGKVTGEVVRRAQVARKKVAVIAGRVEEMIGVHAVGAEGRMLDATALAALAHQVAREALGL